MATVKFEGFDAYEQMLAKLGDSTDSVLKTMVNAGLHNFFHKALIIHYNIIDNRI